MNNDLISREALTEEMRKSINERYPKWDKPITVADIATLIFDVIDNAPTVEMPENAVNCVLTMFGNCSYNKTGCSDCEIKYKIRKALEERLQGEWIEKKNEHLGKCLKHLIECSVCGSAFCFDDLLRRSYCPNCGADMQKGGAE